MRRLIATLVIWCFSAHVFAADPIKFNQLGTNLFCTANVTVGQKKQLNSASTQCTWQIYCNGKERPDLEAKAHGSILTVADPIPGATYIVVFNMQSTPPVSMAGSWLVVADAPPRPATDSESTDQPDPNPPGSSEPILSEGGAFDDRAATAFVQDELLKNQQLRTKDPKYRTHLANLQKQLAGLQSTDNKDLENAWALATEMNALGTLRSGSADYLGRGLIYSDIDWGSAWAAALKSLESHLDGLDSNAKTAAYAALARALAGEKKKQDDFVSQIADHLVSTNSMLVPNSSTSNSTSIGCGCGRCRRCCR